MRSEGCAAVRYPVSCLDLERRRSARDRARTDRAAGTAWAKRSGSSHRIAAAGRKERPASSGKVREGGNPSRTTVGQRPDDERMVEHIAPAERFLPVTKGRREGSRG